MPIFRLTKAQTLIAFLRTAGTVLYIAVNSVVYPDGGPGLVGTYSPLAQAGGYVWDDVLEYRVWCHPERRSPELDAATRAVMMAHQHINPTATCR